jgi:hypothetical protein
VNILRSKGYDGGLSVGQRQFSAFHGSGPTSYSQATGDVIQTVPGIYLDNMSPCMDSTGTYYLIPFPSAVDTTRATWTFKWYVAATMAQVGNGVNLSTFNVQFGAWYGEF